MNFEKVCRKAAALFLAVVLPPMAALANDGRDDSIRIVSPVSGAATNTRTLEVKVRYDLRRHGRDERGRELRLWLDQRLVGRRDLPRRDRDGYEVFSLDVATHRDAAVRLEAALTHEGGRVIERSRAVTVVLDKTPPRVRIGSPLNGQIVDDAAVSVRGAARDSLSGLASLTLNGERVAAHGGSFRARMRLPFAVNPLVVIATDRAGNVTTLQQQVLFSTEPATQPVIQSDPVSTAFVGRSLTYQVVTAAAHPDRIEYSLPAAPRGMAIDPSSGLVSWRPDADQAGTHAVTVLARDAGGEASQSFTVSVFESRPVASQRISAQAGGVITVADASSALNGLSVTIPPNALAADTTIEISQLTGTAVLDGASRFFLKGISIEPDGTALAAPATIRLPYDPAEFGAGHGLPMPELLGAYFWNPQGGGLEALPEFSADAADGAVTGTTPHFSVYFFANLAQLCPPPSGANKCPDSVPPLADRTPAVLVHGYQLSGNLGDESTWGNLRTLLGDLDEHGAGRVDAWRFDWDSRNARFELTAEKFARALSEVTRRSGKAQVNVVAHSFGGILARAYLQNRAQFGRMPYRGDVRSLMTIGTPHQGIGGLNSGLANLCPRGSARAPNTCFQTSTGAPAQPEEGEFLAGMNDEPAPAQLRHVIIGQLLRDTGNGVVLLRGDGLINLRGADIAGGFVKELIASSDADPLGLCHSGSLFSITCQREVSGERPNVAMAEVSDRKHPLWLKICVFLEASEATCNSEGAVKVDFEDVDTSIGYSNGAPVSEYLARFGISTQDAPTVIDTTFYAVYIRSPTKNIISGGTGRNPTVLRLNFERPVDDFGFVRAGVVGANSPSGTIAGPWTVTAYDADNNVLATQSEPFTSFFGDREPVTFKLEAKKIVRVEFQGHDFGFAGINIPHLTNMTFKRSAD
jgi:pimeloyl-ACP methyl ester carboxylesterase